MYNRLGSHLSSREAEGKKPDESGKEAGNENELSSTKDEKTVSNTTNENGKPMSKSALKKQEKMRKLQEYWKEKKKLKKQQKKEKAKSEKKEAVKDGTSNTPDSLGRQPDSGGKGAAEGNASEGKSQVAGGSEDESPRSDRHGLPGPHAPKRNQQFDTASHVQLWLHSASETSSSTRAHECEWRDQDKTGKDPRLQFMARDRPALRSLLGGALRDVRG